MEIVRAAQDYRVKLLDLPMGLQAVWHKRDEQYMQLSLYGYDSKNKPVQFVAPFTFDTEISRDEMFNDSIKLQEFSRSVFITQMAKIDPELNTEKLKTI